MPLANLFVSVYIEPLFSLLVSLSTLLFVILVEFLVVWRSTKMNWFRAAGLAITANLLSTAVGYGVVRVTPSSWDVSTSREYIDENVIVAVLLGYVFCFTFSFLVEAGFYRLVPSRPTPRVPPKTTLFANGLSYVLMPGFMWAYEFVHLLSRT